MYVDGNLMADIRRRMLYTLVAAVEAIFVIMGLPKLMLHQCAVALDKWLMLEVYTIQILLGLLWNTCDTAVSIAPDFRMETVMLLQHTWHDSR